MNEFDERYDIRLANVQDIDDIMRFIDIHWRKGHILSTNREYFEFEFREDENVNFVLAIDKVSKEIEALLGFVRASQSFEKMDIWGSIWKVNNEHDNMKMLGVELQKRLKELTGCRFHNRIGMNSRTAVPIVRLHLGSTVKKMNHYYMLNDAVEEYMVATIVEKNIPKYELKTGGLKKIDTFEELREKIDVNSLSSYPYKDEWYVRRKFFENPKRDYIVYGIESSTAKQIEALFVARECEYMQSKVMRILDYYGNREVLSSIGNNLKQLMYENDYEYIDFYNYGFEAEYLERAGFCLRDKQNKNVIPNYFEPFVKENVEIWVSYDSEGMLFYKADGDQDRANS